MLRFARYPCLFEVLIDLPARQSRAWPPKLLTGVSPTSTRPPGSASLGRRKKQSVNQTSSAPGSQDVTGPHSGFPQPELCDVTKVSTLPPPLRGLDRPPGSAEPGLTAIHSCVRPPDRPLWWAAAYPSTRRSRRVTAALSPRGSHTGRRASLHFPQLEPCDVLRFARYPCLFEVLIDLPARQSRA